MEKKIKDPESVGFNYICILEEQIELIKKGKRKGKELKMLAALAKAIEYEIKFIELQEKNNKQRKEKHHVIDSEHLPELKKLVKEFRQLLKNSSS